MILKFGAYRQCNASGVEECAAETEESRVSRNKV